MNVARRIFESLGWLAIAGALWVTASIYLRPSVTNAVTVVAPTLLSEYVVPPAEEVRSVLRNQPDVDSAEVTVFTEPGKPALVLVSLTWSTPTPPPRRRLETIAKWARQLFGGDVRVHVVTPTKRFELNS